MSDPRRVWVVDDDHSVRFVLAAALREAGHAVREFATADAALSSYEQLDQADRPELVLTDVRMPGTGGLDFLEQLKQRDADLPVIVMSAFTDVGTTAGAFRGGAHEYLAKPFDLDEVIGVVARALPQLQDEDAKDIGATNTDAGANGEPLIGSTPTMRELFRAIGKLAQVPLSVLITGETGTGKELVARALHRESPRARQPFIALNTAAIPAELLESELFGHEAGAFTGAQKQRIGRFEQADGGTLFLDEIGDMPAALQTRLLRVLAEGEFFRVGGRGLIRVDVRVIAATHQDLQAKVARGEFRADLLHRLDVVRLQLPPLRERAGDVSALAEHFLIRACRQLGIAPKRWAKDAMEALQAHAWPGNVRELENTVWRIAALASGETLRRRDVQAALREVAVPSASSSADNAIWTTLLAADVRRALQAGQADVHERLRQAFDHAVLQAALEVTDGHRQQAAERLGVGRNTLTRKMGASRTRRRSDSDEQGAT